MVSETSQREIPDSKVDGVLSFLCQEPKLHAQDPIPESVDPQVQQWLVVDPVHIDAARDS